MLTTSQYESPLWVITSYYNPQRYQRRLQNFFAFQKNLHLPLLVVELEKEGEHQLSEGCADVLIKLTGESFIWQKERLLNIAIENLPANVKYVAWIDCDVVFERDDWAEEAMHKLQANGGLVQLFGTVVHCPREFDPLKDSITALKGEMLFKEISAASIAAKGQYQIKTSMFNRENNSQLDVETHLLNDPLPEAQGHAWAACVEDLRKIKIYDGNIVGGGDSIMFYCAAGVIEEYLKMRHYSDKHQEHILAWDKKAREEGLLQSIDYVAGNLYHYWHGDFKHRFYKQRHVNLISKDFDPTTALQLVPNGTWAWTQPRGELANGVRSYFLSRQEDGVEETLVIDLVSK